MSSLFRQTRPRSDSLDPSESSNKTDLLRVEALALLRLPTKVDGRLLLVRLLLGLRIRLGSHLVWRLLLVLVWVIARLLLVASLLLLLTPPLLLLLIASPRGLGLLGEAIVVAVTVHVCYGASSAGTRAVGIGLAEEDGLKTVASECCTDGGED